MNEILKRIEAFLDSYPVKQYDHWKKQLFAIFREASVIDRVSGDQLHDRLRDSWMANHDLTDDQRDNVFEMCSLWSEWLFVFDELGEATV